MSTALKVHGTVASPDVFCAPKKMTANYSFFELVRFKSLRVRRGKCGNMCFHKHQSNCVSWYFTGIAGLRSKRVQYGFLGCLVLSFGYRICRSSLRDFDRKKREKYLSVLPTYFGEIDRRDARTATLSRIWSRVPCWCYYRSTPFLLLLLLYVAATAAAGLLLLLLLRVLSPGRLLVLLLCCC